MIELLNFLNDWKALVAIGLILISTKAWLGWWIGLSSFTKKLETNHFPHLVLHNDYQDKKAELRFQFSLNDMSKETYYKEKGEIEEWYNEELRKLNSPGTFYRKIMTK
jgi:hypothetical protein